ncbi:carbohydrate-binding module family 21 protein [Moniliophthora roreri MCA 2997]|uniref:Carbohydrate-binding module family 21 protein n=1 Tax=Moniliophthora roreri (strain MCA 2997) TaxID=1381753 RepID=V2WTS0_MONRO|nr:carbohydrate-binding module family 21 protein [Moniliophthora roreri MCA 2997]
MSHLSGRQLEGYQHSLPRAPTPISLSTSSGIGLYGSPVHGERYFAPFRRSLVTRTTRSPTLLANGEPLKSSFKASKCASKSVDVPATPKTVHFPSFNADLEHIKVFDHSSEPISFLRRSLDVSRGPTGVILASPLDADGEGTETETENAGDFGQPATNAVPKLFKNPKPAYVLDMAGYPIPSPATVKDACANIVMEKIEMRGEGEPLALKGSILVRNIAFEKRVYICFTLDNWTTVSEVSARYASSLTLSSQLAVIGQTLPSSNGWDRFTFNVNISNLVHLEEKVMWFVGRYVVPGRGEWWDNNGGADFRVGWHKAPTQGRG